jgi:F-type H+-transporting ATPase subunit a
MEYLPKKIEALVHKLMVLPYNDPGFEGVVGPTTLTNYTTWLIMASTVVVLLFIVVARKEQQRMALASQSGNVTDLAPTSRLVGIVEAGVEFIRNMAIDVIGPKDGPRFTALLGTFFFLILTANLLGLIPGGNAITGSLGGTTALALLSWAVFVWVGFAKNGFVGYFKSLVPSGVREMGLAGKILLGGFLFILEFVATFIVRPLTLAVRLFANIYAGHIILGIFSAFVWIFWAFFYDGIQTGIGGIGIGAVSLLFLVLMYAFEVFVAFIQAYVFTILTAVYIQSSVHASDH